MPVISFEEATQKKPKKVLSFEEAMGAAPQTQAVPDPAMTAETPLARQLRAAHKADPMGAMAAPPGIPQEHIPDLMTADLNARPERPGLGERFGGAIEDVTRSTIDLLRSGGQRTTPVVRNIKGEFIQPYVGEFFENPTASGNIPMAKIEGGAVPIDPERHVVKYDPVTKKDQVFERTEETAAGPLESAGHMLGTGMVANAATRLPGGVVTKAPPKLKEQLLDDFTRMGVQPSQPVISQGKATGTMAQMLGRVPGAADVVTRQLKTTLNDTVEAVNRVANKFGSPGTRDRAGRIIQGGVDRAGRVVEGAANAASMPSRFTSLRTKADALYKRATGMVGEGAQVPMARTREALKGILNRTGVESVDTLLRNPELRGIAEAVEQEGALPFEAARQLRSKLGKLTRSGGDDVLKGIDKAEVDRLYGAMTEDLMSGARKAGGPQAAHALRRADQFYAAGHKRINNSLKKIFRADSPEKAYEQLLNMLSEKTSANMQAAYSLKRTLRPEEWNDVAATVIERMGKPTAGATSNLPGDEAFSLSTFATNYNRLSEKGREVLFGGPLRKEMEALSRVVSAQKEFEKLANVSASGSHALQGAGGVFLWYEPASALGLMAGGRATAELLMSPKFVRWLHQAGTARLPAERAVLMGDLQKLVQQEPHLAIPLQKVLARREGSDADSYPPIQEQ